MKDNNKKLDSLSFKFDNKIDKNDEVSDKLKEVDLKYDKK